MSQDDIDLPSIDWSGLTGFILSGASHALMILLTPLRLTGKTTLYICPLPLRVIIWPFKVLGRFILYILGFRRRGVDRGTRLMFHHYGGYVPRDSAFTHFQSYGATSDGEAESAPQLAVPGCQILVLCLSWDGRGSGGIAVTRDFSQS
ncbi:hypothetical protein K503DRAFT_767140 [Rhizopogon vinicolor AM-OR11-026]|uniref:Uncharacterized protein n=1 Tax=Rhizopogon vinicolor AM-OR11-026 TaxID=1314800 RepID=A0A1B7NB67_9AGAM|nr:hypothetical protein K503DRAFT_767140 [Rhizopogon vinicolor AM-OR11-026]